MQNNFGCLYNFANIDRIDLTEQDKIQISKNGSHYYVGIVAVLLVNQAYDLHCSNSAITLQAAVPFFSSKHGGKRPLTLLLSPLRDGVHWKEFRTRPLLVVLAFA